ncbi:MAG: hypothetical protein NZ516_10450 [Raineya sp.]|nr:hypothetical protein [Raineya sp.]
MENLDDNQLQKQSENDLLQILNSKPVETLIKAFADLMTKTAENEKYKLVIEEKELANDAKQLEIDSKNIELDTKRLEVKKEEIKLVSKLDLVSKIYAITGVTLASIIVYFFSSNGLMNKNSAETLITLLIGLLITGGASVLKSFLEKEKRP